MSKIVALSPDIDCPPNDPRMEWLYDAIQDLPPGRQKRMIVMAALEPVGFLNPQQAHVMLASLGLEEW